MKTAILLVGAMRTFDKCLATQAWHVYRRYPDADFFVSTVQDADTHKANLLVEKYGAARVKIDVVAEQPDCVAEMRAAGVKLPEDWQRGKPYTHEPFPISVHPQAVLRQLWQLNRVWGRFELGKYDAVIRCRPDLWFQRFAPFRFEQDARVAYLPWWGKFGGVNDRFAVLGANAAEMYFTTYGAIPYLALDGCPMHPESLIAARLDAEQVISVPRLAAEFATLRSNGEMRQPEISASDIADYARGDNPPKA